MDLEYIGTTVLSYLIDAAVSTGIILCFFGGFLFLALLLQLVTMSLRRRWYELLGERSWIALAAPGTVIHEAGHALFCLLFRHKILEMKLFAPAPDGTMGMVSHSWDSKSYFQKAGNFFIGTGPIFTGTAVIVLITILLVPEIWDELESPGVYSLSDLGAGLISVTCGMLRPLFCSPTWLRWQSWVWLIGILLIGSHITLSKEDFKNTASGIFLIPAGVFLLNLALIWYTNPATWLLQHGSGVLICLLAILLFIIIILGSFTLFLHLPVFLPEQKKSARR
jgi:hypothetical protein